MCSPAASVPASYGDSHRAGSAPLSEHMKKTSGSVLVVENVNVALVLSVTSSGAGPEMMVVTGGAFTSHVQTSGVGSQFPQASRARTWNTCTCRERSTY